MSQQPRRGCTYIECNKLIISIGVCFCIKKTAKTMTMQMLCSTIIKMKNPTIAGLRWSVADSNC